MVAVSLLRCVLVVGLILGLGTNAWAQSAQRPLPERKPTPPARVAPQTPAAPAAKPRTLPQRKPETAQRSARPAPSQPAVKLATRAEPVHLNAREREVFARALKLAAAGKWSEARAQAETTKNPLLVKVTQWVAMRTPGAILDFSTRTAFLEANPGWPAAAEMRRITEDIAERSGGPDERLRWFSKHPPTTTAGRVAYVDALLSSGDVAAAEKLARETWVTGRFDIAAERDFLNRFGRFITPQDHNARLEELLYAEQRPAAERMFNRVEPARAAVGAVRSALISEAANVERLIDRLPKSLINDPGLIYDRIKWRRGRDLDDEARALLPTTPDTAPRPDLWWRERQLLARDSFQKGRAREAYTIVQNHGALDAASIADAEWYAGWLALRHLNEPETALQHFQRVYDTVQLAANVSRGAYWTGRAAEALNRPDIAADWYRKAAVHITTFYGQLALGRLSDPVLPQLPQDPTPTAQERDAFEERDLTKAVRALSDVTGTPHLRVFLQALAETTDFAVDRHMAAELAARLGRIDIGVWIARQAGRDRIIIVEHGYPVPPIALAPAPERAFALAIMRQESNFDPGAQSSAGALGLMQLMPATARQMARATKQQYNKTKLTRDPAYNIKLGSYFLNDLVQDFDGSYIMAAAAYNAGPSRARQWAATFGDPRSADVDAVDWVESIPFNETRNYVQRVMENVMVYRAVLAKTTPVPQTLEKELKVARPQ